MSLSKPLAVSSPEEASQRVAAKVFAKQDDEQAAEPFRDSSLKPSGGQEQQGSHARLLQEKHAMAPLCGPEMNGSNSSVLVSSEVDAVPKKHVPAPSRTSELRGLDALSAGEVPTGSGESTEVSSAENSTPRQKVSLEKTDGAIFTASFNGHVSSDTKSAVDTAAPFESVKDAVALFGEGMDWNLQSQMLEEKRVAPGVNLEKAKQQIAYYKARLISKESFIVNAIRELQKTKEQIRLRKAEVPIMSPSEGGLPPSSKPEEFSAVGVARDAHMNVLMELESAQKEVEAILERLSQAEKMKQSDLKEVEVTMRACDNATTRVQELQKEYASKQESLAAAKATLAEIESAIASLRSVPTVKLNNASAIEPTDLRLEFLKIVESSVIDYDSSMEKLMEEIATIRDVEVSSSAGELLGAQVRLEQAKIAEDKHVAALGRVLEQLDETKINLKKVMDEGASLPSAIGACQAEISKHQAELEGAHETEQIACATLASLQDELCSVRAKVLSAQAGEAKAREAKRTLPAAIKQMALDADAAKAASNLAREEARKGRLEIQQAKAGLSTTVSKLQAAQKEAEAARASEAAALAEFKALSESEGELGGKVTVTISFEEYRALHDAGLEAEEAASQKVAVIFMQVKAATASEQEAQGKLDVALKELEVLKKAMEEAQKKADDAQAAKLSVESELRKWRGEHEQWRKIGSNPSSVSTSAAQSPRFLSGKSGQVKSLSHSFQGKPVTGLDASLAEILTLKVPSSEKALSHSFQGNAVGGLDTSLTGISTFKVQSSEKAAKVMPETDLLKTPAKVKKLSFFARVISMIVRRKSKKAR